MFNFDSNPSLQQNKELIRQKLGINILQSFDLLHKQLNVIIDDICFIKENDIIEICFQNDQLIPNHDIVNDNLVLQNRKSPDDERFTNLNQMENPNIIIGEQQKEFRNSLLFGTIINENLPKSYRSNTTVEKHSI